MKEFREEYLPNWEKFLKTIFNDNIPEYYEWRDTQDIIRILNEIASSNALNHTFFPSGGGMDLTSAIESHEKGCIEIDASGPINIIKVRKLSFQYFPDGDYEWAYFRIITDDLASTSINEDLIYDYELVMELSPANYVDEYHLEDDQYNGRFMPLNPRLVRRILKGDLVIFNKASLYNSNLDTYDARHDKFGVEGFRQHIKDVIDYFNQLK